MRIISTSYSKTPEYTDPQMWLERISFYTGILEELAKQHEVISFERINYEGEYRRNNVLYYFIKLKKKRVLFPWRMHRLIKKLKPDIIFVNGSIFSLQIIQLRLKVGRKVKIIIMHRAEKPFTGLKKYFQKIADKCIDAYLFSSLEFCKDWKKNIDVKKVHEVMQASSVYHPVCRSTVQEITNVKDHPVFLWVGRLEMNKDPVTVVKAFIQLLSWQPSALLYMIYQTEELLNEITRLAANNSSSIKLIGKVERSQLQNWYSSADFILSGSHYEGSGVAIAEAMSCGCIPVVTDIPSFRMMTANGEYGLLYKAGNEHNLLSALLKTTEMDIAKKRFDVLEQFKNQLSFEAIARKINAIIN